MKIGTSIMLLLLGTLLTVAASATTFAAGQAGPKSESTPGPSAVPTGAPLLSAPASGRPAPATMDCGPNWVLGPSHNNPVESNVLTGVAAVAGDDLWAVGSHYTNTFRTLVEHWNGSAWSVVPSPNQAGGSGGNYLSKVAKVTANDVWAVGYYYDMNNIAQTLVERWNGAAWSIVSSPNQGMGGSMLNDVVVVSANDIWAAGAYWNASHVEQTLVEHWNGANWSIISSPSQGASGNVLNGVAAAGPADVWAVGAYNAGGNVSSTLVEHWNGSAWSLVAAPNPGADTNALDAVAAGPAGVWAVGDYSNNSNTYATLVERWNGSTWSVVASPNPGNNGASFGGIAIAGAGDVWAVGAYYDSNNNFHNWIEHWNGTVWSVVADNTSATFTDLRGVAVAAPGDVWAVGEYGANSGETITEHWDGTTWSVVASPNAGPLSDNFLWDVTALARNDMWAVGDYKDDSNASQTLAQHWDGSVWSDTASANVQGAQANQFSGVAAAGANDAWAVGNYKIGNNAYQTLAEHWTDTIWNIAPTPNVGSGNNFLNEVAVVAPNDVWAVGDYANNNVTRTLVEHWDGAAWSVVPSPNPGAGDYLFSVAGAAANDIWAVGRTYLGNSDQTLIEHWNGSAWSLVPSPNPVALSAELIGVVVSAPGNVWAVGDYTNNNNAVQTLVEHWNGTAWTIVNSPNPGIGATLQSVSGAAANDVWAAGYYFAANNSTHTLIEHWDGTTWSVAPSPSADPYASYLFGVAVAGPDDVWAVGTFVNNANVATNQILTERYNPCPSACAVTFNDVPSGSTFYPYVHCLACQGIISGYQCGGQGEPCPGLYFRPGNPVTRGQVSKFVVNAAGFQNPIPSGQQTFQDVPPTNPFWLYVERLSEQGYISGYACGQAPAGPCIPPGNRPYFLPGNNVTRGQLAKIDANAVGYNNPPSVQTLEDVPPANPFYIYIERVALHQVISGYPCGHAPAGPCVPPANRPYYAPGNNVTRGQTSKIVSNTFFPGCQIPLLPSK